MTKLQTEFHNFIQNLKALELFIKVQDELMNINFRSRGIKNNDFTQAAAELLSDVLQLSKNFSEGNFDIQIINETNEKFADKGVNIFAREVEDKETREVAFKITNSQMEREIGEIMRIVDLITRQKELLYRNSLTSLMIYFENLISNIIKMRLFKFPNAFNPNEKSIKYRDLMDFESLDEALEHLIEIEVIDIMYGGFKSWISYLNKAGVNTKKIDLFTEVINEAYSRRNLFVHNDGVINNVYLNKVSKEYSQKVTKGQRLSISEDYLNKAVHNVKIFGVILLLEAWKVFNKDGEDDANDYIFKQAFESMQEQDWEFAKFIYEFLLAEADTHADKIITQMNIWLCEKELGNFEEIKKSIRNCDVSGLQTYFQLVKLSLLENSDEFFRILDRDPDSLDIEELREWPILKYMREDSRMKKYLQEVEGITIN
ncbi:hypothetical protein [Lysinibacillus sp. NPDC056232]|uniref:hypothetical protein n=1 Tax=Lysinibacillus sp. NPDC056232 TaxID=3345756 RepID=UPI0035E29203